MRRREKPYQVEQATRAVKKLNELNPTYDDYMRSKACDQVTHSRGLTPHRLILRQIFQPITNGDSVKQNGKLFLREQSNTFFLSFRKCKTIHYCLQRASFIVCLTTVTQLLIATLHIIHEQQYLSLHYCCCCFYLLACHFFIPSVAYDYIGTLLSETI